METVYNLLGWKDFLKKRACRYLLQHYLGQFLKEKLTLDQLSIDLYNGTGTISDLELDVETLNENLNSFSIPLEIVDGFISHISVSVPWACLVQDSTQLDIHGLELTLKPKQRYHNVAPLGEMFCSMSMTSSLQLAQHCLESEKIAVDRQLGGTEKIEGVQKFAQMIDSVLTKVKVTLTNTVVRLEHIPTESEKGVALEVRIKRIEYFDELANILTSEGTSVDGGQKNPSEPPGIANKNLKIEGLQIFFDEFNNVKVMQKHSMEQMPELSVDMCASVFGSLPEDPPEIESSQSSAFPPINSEPVLVAIVTGQQELKLKLKQNDSLQGPKLNVSCQFGSLHILLSPRQLHGILELASGLAAPVSSDSSPVRGHGTKSRPMSVDDQKRVEVDLQSQMLSNRMLYHRGHSIDCPLQSLESEEDQYFSLAGDNKTHTDNESLVTSTYSASTVPGSSRASSSGKVHRESGGGAFKSHEDPSAAEQSQCHFRLSFLSATILHNNPVMCPNNSPTRLSPSKSMKEVSNKFFHRVAGINVVGLADVKEVRTKFEELIAHDHLRLLGKPLNVECNQKSSVKESSLTVHVTMGFTDLVETLYAKQGTVQVPAVNELLTTIYYKEKMATGGQTENGCSLINVEGVTLENNEIDEFNMLKISEPMVDNRKVGESETSDDNCQNNMVENHEKLPLEDTPFSFLKSLIPMMLTDGLEEGRKRNNKVIEFVHPKELEKRLDWMEISGEGTEDSKLLDACADIIKYSVKTGHPRFCNQLFGGMDEYSLAGSWLTEVLNTSQYTYEVAPVFTIMEKSIYKKLLSFVGFENGEGIFCPGGSVANIYAVNSARYKRHPEIKTKGMTALEKPLVLLTSEKCHFSFNKAAMLLGIGTDYVYTVKTDARGCMIPEELDRRIEEAYDNGLEPFFVNATAGTTVRGAYDPIDKIADVCKKHHLWLHVDGAWGGSALMSRTYRHYLKGIDRSDSVTWDPHKLMGAPLQCAVILTRHKDVLKQCNSACAVCLFQQDKCYDLSYDTGDMSIQCSRKVDVLKLWMLWKAKGDTGFEKDIDNAFHCSRYLAQKLKRTPGFRLLDEPQCTNVCFWYIPHSLRDQPETEEWWQKLHRVAPAIKKRMMETGSMMIGYQPDGKYVNFFRMIVTNLDTTEEDMDFLVDEISRLGKDL